MKTKIAAILAACAGWCSAQSARPGAYPPPGYHQQWADDFNGRSLDLSRWMYRTDVKALSSQRPENVRVENGRLVILLKKEDHRGMHYTGGGIITREGYRYGYYEARVKMHGATGWHQSVWAMAAGDGSTTYPESMRTEIDGLEFDSEAPSKGHMGLILWRGPKQKRPQSCSPGVYRNPLGFDASSGFHTYGFEWTPKTVSYYVDGDLRCVLDYPPEMGEHDPINFWLTAIAYQHRDPRQDGSRNLMDDGALPGRMEVDFAAFYTRDGRP